MDRYKIEKGDRIFARLTMGGRTLVEIMLNGIGSVSEVISELRRMCGEVRGLAKLYIRNHSRGWSFDKGLMVYSREGSLRQKLPTYTWGVLPLDIDVLSDTNHSLKIYPSQTL